MNLSGERLRGEAGGESVSDGENSRKADLTRDAHFDNFDLQKGVAAQGDLNHWRESRLRRHCNCVHDDR